MKLREHIDRRMLAKNVRRRLGRRAAPAARDSSKVANISPIDRVR
jgi:hypothetical protein